MLRGNACIGKTVIVNNKRIKSYGLEGIIKHYDEWDHLYKIKLFDNTKRDVRLKRSSFKVIYMSGLMEY